MPLTFKAVLDMLELIIIGIIIVYIIKTVLKHNLFISKIKIKIKFLGLDIEIHSKKKKHPSRND